MGTTDATLAAAAVNALAHAGVRFAFLHREDDVACGRVASDMDLLVDRPPGAVLAAVAAGWRADGLVPVMASTYDVGCTALWLSTADGWEGVQVDLTHDRNGRNHFGATTAWLERARPGTRWPVVAPEHVTAYVANKHAAKRRGRGVRLRDVPRLAGRVVDPPGFWLHVITDDAGPAEDVVARFDRYLPGTEVVHAPSGSAITTVLRARRATVRARLVLTTSSGAVVGPDLVTAAASTDALARGVVHAMSRRVLRRLDRVTGAAR